MHVLNPTPAYPLQPFALRSALQPSIYPAASASRRGRRWAPHPTEVSDPNITTSQALASARALFICPPPRTPPSSALALHCTTELQPSTAPHARPLPYCHTERLRSASFFIDPLFICYSSLLIIVIIIPADPSPLPSRSLALLVAPSLPLLNTCTRHSFTPPSLVLTPLVASYYSAASGPTASDALSAPRRSRPTVHLHRSTTTHLY